LETEREHSVGFDTFSRGQAEGSLGHHNAPDGILEEDSDKGQSDIDNFKPDIQDHEKDESHKEENKDQGGCDSHAIDEAVAGHEKGGKKAQKEDEHRFDVNHEGRANQIPSVQHVVNHIRRELNLRELRINRSAYFGGILSRVTNQDDLPVENRRDFLDIQNIHERIVGKRFPCAFELNEEFAVGGRDKGVFEFDPLAGDDGFFRLLVQEIKGEAERHRRNDIASIINKEEVSLALRGFVWGQVNVAQSTAVLSQFREGDGQLTDGHNFSERGFCFQRILLHE